MAHERAAVPQSESIKRESVGELESVRTLSTIASLFALRA
jgi:hypothetical protein